MLNRVGLTQNLEIAALSQSYIDLLLNHDTLIVALSGGLDSTVLLHLVASDPALQKKTRAIHVNHGLSPHATLWQEHCEALCQALAIPLSTFCVQVNATQNTEEDARLKRYAVFRAELSTKSCLLMGHHEDDAAETFFLHLMRGTGLKGLSGMCDSRPLGQGVLYRPLLRYSRAQIKAYALTHQLHWILDESNENQYFSRNYLRHAVLPLLQKRWPSVNKKISECMHHLHEAQHNLYALAKIDCPALTHPTKILPYQALLHLNEARLMNVIMTWLHCLNIQAPNSATCRRIVREVMYAPCDAIPIVTWGGTYRIRRYAGCLYIDEPCERQYLPQVWLNFPEPLVLSSHEVLVARQDPEGVYIPPGSQVEIRYRVGGEVIRLHQQTQLLKKLFQAHGVPPWVRETMPLVYVNHELVSAVDFLKRDPYDDATAPYIYHIERREQDDVI